MSNDFDKELNDLMQANDKKKAEEFINKRLSEKQKNELNNILKDKEKLNQILSSEKARQVMNKFKNK